MRFFVTAARGTEAALVEELQELGINRLSARPFGVEMSGRFVDAQRVCLESRIALRVLWPLAEFPVSGADDLYEGVRAVQWEEHLDASRTLAVSAVGAAPGLDHTVFVAQKTKDAIVDRLRDGDGRRPSVDRHDPDVAVFVRLARGRATVSLDLAGESLHRRGARGQTGAAPLKENLAAAVLRLSGWDRKSPLCDPLCGSGTLAVEADLWARRVAPGLARRRFGFQRWASYDEALRRDFQRVRERAAARQLDEGPLVIGRDRDARAIEHAHAYAQAAAANVRFEAAPLGKAPPSGPLTMCSNPPYGQRLEAPEALWRELDQFIERLGPGSRVALLVARQVPWRPPPHARVVAMDNGAIECRFTAWTCG